MFRNNLRSLRAARSATHSQLGMTLLEILIVLAIIAVIMGVVVGPRVIAMFQGSKVQTTQLLVNKIATEAYSYWTMETGKACPTGLEDMKKYNKKMEDDWGNKLIMLCGDDAPEGAQAGFAVMSKGPDGKQGTEDDIKSWEE